MFEDQTFEVILKRMLDRVPESMDKRESSPIYTALAPAAVEIVSMYIAFDCMLKETFGDTASRAYLIRLCADRGLEAKAATSATLQIESNIVIPLGKRFTGGDHTYIVSAEGQVTCEQSGVAGNEYLGELIPIEYIDGLTTAQITEVLIYGEDEEDTESLRKRYYESFDERSFSGNARDYKNKTLSISGVGAVKIIRTWDGPGSVKLVILDSIFGKASKTLVDTVQHAFDPNQDGMGDGLAPIGHVVTVDTVEEIKIDFSIVIQYDTGYELNDCKSNIEITIEDYLESLRKNWENSEKLMVRIASVAAGIMSVKGVIDVSDITINGSIQNFELADFQIPVLGGIVYV